MTKSFKRKATQTDYMKFTSLNKFTSLSLISIKFKIIKIEEKGPMTLIKSY